MTLKEVYLQGKYRLKKAGNTSPAFDCICIFEHCFGINREGLVFFGSKTADINKYNKFLNIIDERINGKPLQYIIGEWSFMDIKLEVGEGVLIPRDDTEVLVEEALSCISKIKNPKIVDLCAGTGAISIAIAIKRPDADIICVELHDDAYKYLIRNIEKHEIKNIKALKYDVLSKELPIEPCSVDIIVSNPPYIPTKDLKTLQKEVMQEPRSALDGGEDGLVFYKGIVKNLSSTLKSNGQIAFEIGLGQDEEVSRILVKNKFININKVKDINKIIRVISAKLNQGHEA